jgi:Na+/H+ antiporter NhaD/arsenite permease-like protein
MQTITRKSCKYLATPIFGVLMGLMYLVAFWAGGSLAYGVFGLAVMVAFSLLLLVARRHSETVRGLLDHRDERITAIDLRATAVTALAMIAVVLVAFVVEIARGQSGWPYSMIGAVGGLAYLVAVVVLRVRG